MLNDASWASFGLFNNNTFPNRLPKKTTYNLMPDSKEISQLL